jgi:hypothetical protein
MTKDAKIAKDANFLPLSPLATSPNSWRPRQPKLATSPIKVGDLAK